MPHFIKGFRNLQTDASHFQSSSNELQILLVIDNSWLLQESPDLNPDWSRKIRLFSSKKSTSSLKISLSKIFRHIGSNETGQ